MIKKLLIFILFFSVSSFKVVYADQKIGNYLGTGSDPRLHLELSENNGPGWKPFSIDYQEIGNLPWSNDPSKDWSPWNVKDEDGNYYGTITLRSDGNKATFDIYVPGQNSYLEGVHFSFNAGAKAYQLTADKIHNKPSTGPFPSAPLAQPAVYPNTDIPIVLSTYGSNIVNDKGKKIILKGVVRPSLEWNAQGEKLSEQDIKNMRNWGANVIRIDLNQNYWFNSGPTSQIGSYKQVINAIVYYAIQNNMAVILDLHWTENGHQSNMANKDSIRFWKEVAAEYKNFGTVLFELFNEPVNIDQNSWLSGNNVYAGYQQLYDAIRSVGANNICIINGLDWGYNLSFVNDDFKINGYNIVYGSHPYNRTTFDNNFQGVLGKYPLIFTEFGINQNSYFPNGYQSVYKAILGFSNQFQISYTGFAWWVDSDASKVNTFPDLIQDWSGTPLNGGTFIHDDMKIYPGTPFP
jgi:hypothetical protein